MPLSEFDLHDVIKVMKEGFILLDSHFCVLEINDALLQLDGRSQGEIVGHWLWQIYPQSENTDFDKLCKKARLDNAAVDCECEFIWHDHRKSWLEVRAFPVARDRLVLFIRDNTQLRYRSLQSRKNEKRFIQLIENIRAVFYVHELEEDRLSYISPAYADIWGQSIEEAYADSKAFLKRIHPEDRERVMQAPKMRSGSNLPSLQYRLVADDGHITHIHDRAFLTVNPDTGLPRIVGIAQDVTAATEQSLALERSAETYEKLISRAPFGIHVIDSEFKLRYASLGSKRVFAGIDPLLGRDFGEILRVSWPEPFVTEIIQLYHHTLETGESYVNHSTVEQRKNSDTVEAFDWRIDQI
ncbi:MAG: PAS domain S-box protein, partial [Sphingorhabdus sp.]